MYQQTIKDILNKNGYSDFNPRHIEAWIRLEHSTLDWMSRKRLEQEVLIAIACINQSTIEETEGLVESFSL